MEYSEGMMELLDDLNSGEKPKSPIALQNNIIRRKKVYEGFDKTEAVKFITDNIAKCDESTIMKIKAIIENEK